MKGTSGVFYVEIHLGIGGANDKGGGASGPADLEIQSSQSSINLTS